MFKIYKQKLKFPFRLFFKYGFVVPGKKVLYRIRNNIFSKHPAKATLARRFLISRKILLLKRLSKKLSYLIVKVSKTGKLQRFTHFRIFGATSKFLSSKYKVHPKTQNYLNRVIEQRRQCLNVTKEGAIKPSMNFNCELILHKVDVQNLPMFGTFCCETEFDGYTVYTLNVESRQLDDVPAWTILQDEMLMDQENFQNVIAKNQIKKIIEENRTVEVSLPQSMHDNNNHKTIKDEPLEKEIYTERSMRVREKRNYMEVDEEIELFSTNLTDPSCSSSNNDNTVTYENSLRQYLNAVNGLNMVNTDSTIPSEPKKIKLSAAIKKEPISPTELEKKTTFSRNNCTMRYDCPVPNCDRSFLAVISLRYHIRTAHLGQTPAIAASLKTPDVESAKIIKERKKRTGTHHQKDPESGRFHCQQAGCPKSYTCEPSLMYHIKANHLRPVKSSEIHKRGEGIYKKDPVTRQYNCPNVDCPKTFLNVMSLIYHLSTTHLCQAAATDTLLVPEVEIGLEVPAKTTEQNKRDEAHYKRDPVTRRYHCPNVDCSKTYCGVTSLLYHIQGTHSSLSASTDSSVKIPKVEIDLEVSAESTKKRNVKEGLYNIDPVTKRYPCPNVNCPKSFSCYSGLIYHIDVSKKCLEPKIDSTSKRDDQKSDADLRCHANKRSNKTDSKLKKEEKSFICPACQIVYVSKGGLLYHMNTKHPKRYLCPSNGCENSFLGISSLKYHISSVHSDRKDQLLQEGYIVEEFVEVKRLNKYKVLEVFENKDQNEDSEGFVKVEPVPMQVMDNMDIKPETPESRKKYPTQLFQCRSCEKAFKFQCNLDSHSLVHSDIRSFKCDVCPKKFKQKSHVEQHIMSKHSRHRPYKCTECQKRFAHKGQLKSHAATHAVKFAFLCNLCGHQFRLKQQFKSHMLAEHPNTPAEKKRGRPKKSDH